MSNSPKKLVAKATLTFSLVNGFLGAGSTVPSSPKKSVFPGQRISNFWSESAPGAHQPGLATRSAPGLAGRWHQERTSQGWLAPGAHQGWLAGVRPSAPGLATRSAPGLAGWPSAPGLAGHRPGAHQGWLAIGQERTRAGWLASSCRCEFAKAINGSCRCKFAKAISEIRKSDVDPKTISVEITRVSFGFSVGRIFGDGRDGRTPTYSRPKKLPNFPAVSLRIDSAIFAQLSATYSRPENCPVAEPISSETLLRMFYVAQLHDTLIVDQRKKAETYSAVSVQERTTK